MGCRDREDRLARLLEQPERLRVLVERVRGWETIPEPPPGGWSPWQIVHHLADVHSAGLLRVRRALTEDVPRIENYSHEAWAWLPDAMSQAMSEASLRIFEGTSIRWHALLRGLPDHAWGRTYRNPEIGQDISIDQDLDWHLEHAEIHIGRLSGMLPPQSGSAFRD